MLSKSLLDQILLGPPVGPRFTQDSPILPEVWTALAQAPGARAPLLLTPHKGTTAGELAVALANKLHKLNQPSSRRGSSGVDLAYIENLVAANLNFFEVLGTVLPITEWWQAHLTALYGKYGSLSQELFIRSSLDVALNDPDPPWPSYDIPGDLARIVTLAALICFAEKTNDDISESINYASRLKPLILDATSLLNGILELESPKSDGDALIWLVSLNRPAYPAIKRSVQAIKADAAQRLFDIDCAHLTWAIIDSGIDAEHPAFLNNDDKKPLSRVKAIYDFTTGEADAEPNRQYCGQ